MFELCRVSKRFGQTIAIHPCDLEIPTGRTTVLIGPSGCGKSTLLRLMIGLIQPDAGAVFFDAAQLTPDNALILRQRMGYVIQDGGLFPHLTAQENVELMARHLSWDGSRIASRLSELVELTHFPVDGLTRYPVQLSGGQRQRVSLMRALMLDPHVLLLDEPLGALDPMVRSDLQTELKSIFETLKKTVVLVTHDMSEAAFFGNPILLLRDGSVIQKGTLTELVTTPADSFVTRFVNAQRSPLDALGRDTL
ncbi:MAG: ABC transporter ATP-binding protein [Nitrospiraceae bacterium]|nr:ABC transporter ATP-binding protein [Nitrospiraceae bacterium]